MNPKVSVIIPVYNVERFLQNCIDSLVEQSLDEIEYIFVNDASTDTSLEILERNQKAYPEKIKIINSNVNLKQGGARNLGIKAAKAPYIGFVDSDDFVDKDMFLKLYQRIIQTDADVVFTKYAAVPEDANKYKMPSLEPYIMWNKELLQWDNVELTEEGTRDILANPIGGIYCGLWKKSLFFENDVFFPENLRYEDNYWGSLIACYLKKVSFLHEINYFYRQNAASTVHGKNTRYHLDRIVIENELLNEAKRRGLYAKYQKAWEYIYIQRYALNTFYTLLFKFDEPPVAEMDRIKEDLVKEFPTWKKNPYFKRAKRKEILKSRIMFAPTKVLIYCLKKINK